MTVEASAIPAHPKPGDEVTFSLTVRDDGPVRVGDCVNTQWFGDENAVSMGCMASCPAARQRFGPWDPPPPNPSTYREAFKHVYSKPGNYGATFAYNRAGDCASDPYRSNGLAQVQISVGP